MVVSVAFAYSYVCTQTFVVVLVVFIESVNTREDIWCTRRGGGTTSLSLLQIQNMTSNAHDLQLSGQPNSKDDLELHVAIALQELPHEMRREYDDAIRDAPHIVQNESKFSDFLRVEGNDPVRAATRLARYWKERKKLFGDRWLLPLNQTGTGALSETDIAVLRSGYLQILPRPSGGILALFDESKLTRPVGDSKLRIIFYFSSLFHDHSIRGKTIVHVVNSNERKFSDLQLEKSEWRVRQSIMPGSGAVRPRIFVAQAYEEGKKELLDFLTYKTRQVEQFKSHMPVQTLIGNSSGHILRLLQQQGIEKHLLPPCLGGNYDMTRFNNWIRERITIEGIMSSAPIMLNHLPRVNFQHSNQLSLPPIDQHETQLAQSTVRAACSQSVPGDTASTRSSSLSGRSKRKPTYQKINDCIMNLCDRRDSLRHVNESLRRENSRLEKLLADAHALIEGLQ
jgi:hypothetical protein